MFVRIFPVSTYVPQNKMIEDNYLFFLVNKI